MSARQVFTDLRIEQGHEVSDELELLRQAVRLAPAEGAPTEASDATTRALADEVRESMTLDEGLSLLFPSYARSHRSTP